MKKRDLFYRLIGIFFVFVMLFSVPKVFSDWVYEDKTGEVLEGNVKPEIDTKTPVAYSKINGSNRYFSTIEDALRMTTSGNVYVIPTKEETIISSNCTINKGVSLYLPYEDDGKDKHVWQDEGRTTDANAIKVGNKTYKFADEAESVYCVSKVTIASNVTLTNYGNLYVGGVLGRSSLAPTGMTVGKYAQISMEDNSSIVNYGTITSYGYVKEKTEDNGSILLNSGENNVYGKVILPIVIYDFRGGSYSSYAYRDDLFTGKTTRSLPFSVFDFPNIQVKTSFVSGTELLGTITVYANDSVVIPKSPSALIGSSNSSALIRLSSGTVTYKYNTPKGYTYDDYSKTTTENMVDRTSFVINGNVSIASMSVEIGLSIDTSKIHLPFSYKFGFDFESGTISVSNKIKFLAGSIVRIGKNVQFNINAETAFYSNYIPVITTGRGDGYPRYSSSALLINNGKFSINASFGGVVCSDSENGVIVTQNGFNDSLIITETLTGETGGLKGTHENHENHAKFTLIDKKSYDPNSETNMLYSFSKDANSFDTDTIQKGKTYTSYKLSGYDKYGWYAGDTIFNYRYGIRYALNSDTASNPNSYTCFDTNESGLVLKPLLNSNSSLKFDGFYYSSDFSASSMLEKSADGTYVLNPETAKNYLNGKNYVMLYAKWIDSSKAVMIQFRKYVNDVLVDGVSYSGMVGEAFDLSVCKDTERADTVVENVSKVTYSFKNWIVKDSNGNVINVSNNTFVPQTGNSIYYVEPEYDSTNYLALIVKNKVYYKDWFNSYYSIEEIKVNDQKITSNDEKEYVYYFKNSDALYIKVASALTKSPSVVVSINGEQIASILKGNEQTIDFNEGKYKELFDELKGPIRVEGRS